VKHTHILALTVSTLSFLAACGTTQPTLIQPPGSTNAILGSAPSTTLTAQAAGVWETTRLTTGFDDLTSSAWSKSSGLSVTANALANTVDSFDPQLDKLTGTSTTAMYANTKININTGETIDVSVVVAASGRKTRTTTAPLPEKMRQSPSRAPHSAW
jgi:hypothetical protein